MLTIRQATFEDHKAIIQVSKQSKYTRDFTNHIFSGVALYEKGWIRVAVVDNILESGSALGELVLNDQDSKIVGFTCVRHKVRAPETVLYFIGVDSESRSNGIGQKLLDDLIEQTPHKIIALNVAKENMSAVRFYMTRGFVGAGESLKGKAHHLELHL